MWRQVKERMPTLENELKKKARLLALDPTIQAGNTRRRMRRFRGTAQRNIRAPIRNDGNDHGATTEFILPDLNSINLTTSELTDAERFLLKKGPSFCPVPKDVNWQKVTGDLDKFKRRIRLAVFYQAEILRTTLIKWMIDFQPFRQLPSGCLQNQVSLR